MAPRAVASCCVPSFYRFLARAVPGEIAHAWELESRALASRDRGAWTVANQLLCFEALQLAIVLGISGLAGVRAALAFLAAAAIGAFLLGATNYIEHYGLQRRRRPDGRYERVSLAHSWSCDHPIGHVLLFELTRHADHHADSRRRYQVLRHVDGSPQLPTGYPGMILLALLPPLFFAAVHPRLDGVRARARAA